MDITDLTALAGQLTAKAAQADSGRATETLPAAGTGAFTQRLVALQADHSLSDHQAPDAAVLQVISGRVRFRTEDDSAELIAGQHLAIPAGMHGVDAIDDAVFLLTIAA